MPSTIPHLGQYQYSPPKVSFALQVSFFIPQNACVGASANLLIFQFHEQLVEQLSLFYDDFCSALDLFEKLQILGYFADYVDGAVWLGFAVEDAEGASHRPVG